ncbi:MAG: NUDIX domain-containing protein [Candidatus Nomurabacteria bacterium]|nr:NUDIX domain-containing protein [Candidatus Nomurabacteria bacterium]
MKKVLKKRKEKTLKEATVLYLKVKKTNKIWLSIKADKIGKGCWNGLGGGIKKGETQKKAATREAKEEGKVKVLQKNLVKVAIIDFHNTKSDNTTFVCRVHFYITEKWKGKIKETKEMLKPTLFHIHDLPLKKMMPADKLFLPILLDGKKIEATFHYGPFQKKLIGEPIIKIVNFLV